MTNALEDQEISPVLNRWIKKLGSSRLCSGTPQPGLKISKRRSIFEINSKYPGIEPKEESKIPPARLFQMCFTLRVRKNWSPFKMLLPPILQAKRYSACFRRIREKSFIFTVKNGTIIPISKLRSRSCASPSTNDTKSPY